jgi:hypothetical protein
METKTIHKYSIFSLILGLISCFIAAPFFASVIFSDIISYNYQIAPVVDKYFDLLCLSDIVAYIFSSLAIVLGISAISCIRASPSKYKGIGLSFIGMTIASIPLMGTFVIFSLAFRS